MRPYNIILPFTLLPTVAVAFQVAPVPSVKKQSLILTSHMSKIDNNNNVQDKQLIIPTKQKDLPSKLHISQLSTLTQLKKDERIKFNKQRLLKIGVTFCSAFLTVFKKSRIASATTPLMVTHSNGKAIVKPLLASTPILVEMPGMRGISMSQGFGLPNEGLMFFALALFVTTALLKNAGDGYAKMIHFMSKFISALKDEEKVDLELGLAKDIGWDAYSHDKLYPLQKHYTEEKSSVKLDPRTNLFIEEVMSTPDYLVREEAVEHEKANTFYQELKHKHHNPVKVHHSTYIKASYLDSLATNDQERHFKHDAHLDRMYNSKRSTWGVYKHQLDEVKTPSEVDELKQKVFKLQDFMQDEQAMYQTSNKALKLAVDAHELQHPSGNEELKDFDQHLATNEELKAFDKKAQEYENTVVKDQQEQESSKGFALEWGIQGKKESTPKYPEA